MDPLSDVLSMLRPTDYAFRGLEAGGSWSLHYPADGSLKCFAITLGSCWLYGDAPIGQRRLRQGDVVMVSGGTAFSVCSDLESRPVDVAEALTVVGPGNVARIGTGVDIDCAGLGGYFGFGSTNAGILLAILPEIVQVASAAGEALRLSIARLMEELRCPRPGGQLMASHFAQMLLIEALRHHLDGAAPGRGSWLYALHDSKLSTALGAIHAEPGRPWTVALLAATAGMSRSAFAAHFTDTVGEAPMAYVTRWRMLLACERLAVKGATISRVAASLGYGSDSAFGAAFKRVFGASPRKVSEAS
nr:AraC family transcriptional regulator [uncultured Massilia sp.]